MTLQGLINRYMGWCPRFEQNLTRNVSLRDIPITGKLILSTFVGTMGLLAVLGTILLVPQYLSSDQYPWTNFIIFSNILGFVAGMITIVLLIDVIHKGSIIRRHRLEASLVMILWGAESITSVIMSVWGGYFQYFPMLSVIRVIIYGSLEALLFENIAYRLIANKTVLEKTTYFLLALYFGLPIVSPWLLEYLLDPTWRSTTTVTNEFGLVSQMITYAVACYFFFRAYLEARTGTTTLKLPRYIIIDLLAYGASQTLLGLTTLSPPTWFNYNIFGLTYTHVEVIAVIQSAALLVASIYLFKFRVAQVPWELGL